MLFEGDMLAETDMALASKMGQQHSSEPAVKQTPKRRRGRPSKRATENVDQPRAILDAAVALFAKQGYQATTMSQIASAAGYSQSSLYYWYKSKEEMLDVIVENAGSSLHVAARIAQLPDDKLTQLYAVLYADILMMCNLPCDFYDLEDVARSQEHTLEGFFDTYQRLTDAVKQIMDEGMENGEFVRTDSAYAAVDALAANEGLQHRYHALKRFGTGLGSMVEPNALPLFQSKEELAHHAAATTIKSLAPHCVPADVHRQPKANNWI